MVFKQINVLSIIIIVGLAIIMLINKDYLYIKETKNFFVNNSTQIWTLLSVIIGGLVTYISTSATGRRKNKLQSQKEKLEQILIPYCDCIEKTIAKINVIYKDSTSLYDERNFNKWIGTIKNPLEYLKAAKRVYLSKKARQKLQNYKNGIENFGQTLEKECTNCLIKYKHYLETKLIQFPNIPYSNFINFSNDKTTETKTKIAILSKNNISLLNNLTCIDFVESNDPDNYRYIAVCIDDNIRNLWEATNYGAMDITDIKNPEDGLACALLDFIEENTTDEKDVLSKIINNTKSAELLSIILNNLKDMKKDILKTIDKIAN